MSRRDLRVIGALLFLGACGAPEPGVDVRMKMSPVIAEEAVQATVSLYNAPVSCEVIRISESREGVYNAQVPVAGGTPGTELFELVPGSYQVAVFVFDGDQNLIGFGCDPRPVEIEQGKQSEIGPIGINPI